MVIAADEHAHGDSTNGTVRTSVSRNLMTADKSLQPRTFDGTEEDLCAELAGP
jgi:hypothetical protein